MFVILQDRPVFHRRKWWPRESQWIGQESVTLSVIDARDSICNATFGDGTFVE
jgi:hypothetical protein